MQNISNKVTIILFADDKIRFLKVTIPYILNILGYAYPMQEYLDILYEWLGICLCINKLSINIQKSTAILFNIINSLSSIRLNITINIFL